MFLSLLGISWLWFVGATFLTSFFNFAKDVLSANPDVVTILLATFSIGIGTGSLLCERLSKRRVEIGLVPLGSIGISVFAIDLFFASHRIAPAGHLLNVGEFLLALPHWRILADLFLLAMFGGFYSVPLYALIQARSQPTHRARIIAANNILNSFFMIVSALMALALTSFGVGIPGLFLTTALLNVVVAVYIYSLVPEFLLRFIAWMLVHTFYRIRLVDAERIPSHGAAVLVCNHVSFVDAVVIMAESPRPIRFVMDYRIFRTPFVGWMFRHVKAIPVAPAHEDAGHARTRLRCVRAGAGRRATRLHLSRRQAHAHGRDQSVPAGHRGDSATPSGARRANGAARALGQRVLAPRRRTMAAPDPARRDDAADARGRRADRAGRRDAAASAGSRERAAGRRR